MKIKTIGVVLLVLMIFQGINAQNWIAVQNDSQPQNGFYSQPVYTQPASGGGKMAKFLRILGVALQFAEPLANSPRTTRRIQWASLAVAVGCEIKNCQSTQYGNEYAQTGGYRIAENVSAQNNPQPSTRSYPISYYSEASYYNKAIPSTSPQYVSNDSTYDVSSDFSSQQDQPSSGLRARVQFVIQRIRQLGGAIRNIRFRRVAPWTWECGIVFKLRNAFGDSYCVVRSNGVIEGLP